MATHDQPLKIWLQAENSTRERNELKRLLYVAATRAKGSLLITTAADSRLHFRSFEKLLIDAGCEFEDVEVPATAPANNAGTEGTVTSVADIRLAGDYVFSPLLHDLPGSHAGAEFGEQVEAQREQDDGVFEAACGEVIHKALYRMAIVASACADARDDFAAYVSRWRPRWQAELHALGVSPERLTEAFSRVTRQLDTVLSSDLACAVLAHSDAAFAEFELTSRNATGDAAVNLRIDRICMLGGQRWVIDYKSGNGNSVAFFSAQATRYRPQLERYAHAASHYFGEPVRQGILFTATGTLWDVEADTQVHDLSLP